MVNTRPLSKFRATSKHRGELWGASQQLLHSELLILSSLGCVRAPMEGEPRRHTPRCAPGPHVPQKWLLFASAIKSLNKFCRVLNQPCKHHQATPPGKARWWGAVQSSRDVWEDQCVSYKGLTLEMLQSCKLSWLWNPINIVQNPATLQYSDTCSSQFFHSEVELLLEALQKSLSAMGKKKKRDKTTQSGICCLHWFSFHVVVAVRGLLISSFWSSYTSEKISC